jgi:hypothetical protein
MLAAVAAAGVDGANGKAAAEPALRRRLQPKCKGARDLFIRWRRWLSRRTLPQGG